MRRLGDARDLRTVSLGDSSVDAVVTSPPYSIALDYVKNDTHALEALSVDVASLRNTMTGVRGRGAKQKIRPAITKICRQCSAKVRWRTETWGWQPRLSLVTQRSMERNTQLPTRWFNGRLRLDWIMSGRFAKSSTGYIAS